MFKRPIVIIITLAIIIGAMTGCNSEKSDIKIDEELINIEESRNSNSTSEITDLNVTENDLALAIESNSYLQDNFSFITEYNQTVELGDNNNYIGYETIIFTGKTKEEAENIEGTVANYSVSITTNEGKQYPSNFSISIESDNDIDFENILSHSYKLCGELFPPKLANALQNASFDGLTENSFTTEGLTASVYKETSKVDDNTVTASLNIIISEGVDETVYSNEDDIIMLAGSDSGIYKLGIFDYNSTLDNTESRVAGLFGCKDAQTQLFSVYEGGDGKDKTQSVYAIFNIYNSSSDIINLTISTISYLNSSKNSISIYTNTDNFGDSVEAYKSAEDIIDGLFGNSPDFSQLYSSSSGEVTLTDSLNNTFGFPLKLKLSLNKTDDGLYYVDIEGNSIDLDGVN